MRFTWITALGTDAAMNVSCIWHGFTWSTALGSDAAMNVSCIRHAFYLEYGFRNRCSNECGQRLWEKSPLLTVLTGLYLGKGLTAGQWLGFIWKGIQG